MRQELSLEENYPKSRSAAHPSAASRSMEGDLPEERPLAKLVLYCMEQAGALATASFSVDCH